MFADRIKSKWKPALLMQAQTMSHEGRARGRHTSHLIFPHVRRKQQAYTVGSYKQCETMVSKTPFETLLFFFSRIFFLCLRLAVKGVYTNVSKVPTEIAVFCLTVIKKNIIF